MSSVHRRLEVLRDEADERGLTPLAWWIGEAHHDEVLDELDADEQLDVEVEGDRLREIEGLEVKVLSESPERFALWCEEGALDL